MDMLSSSFGSRQPASLSNIHFYNGPPSLSSTQKRVRAVSPEWPDIDDVVPLLPKSNVLPAAVSADIAYDFAIGIGHPETAIDHIAALRDTTASYAGIQYFTQPDKSQRLRNPNDGQIPRVHDVTSTVPALTNDDDPLPTTAHGHDRGSPRGNECDNIVGSIEPAGPSESPRRECKMSTVIDLRSHSPLPPSPNIHASRRRRSPLHILPSPEVSEEACAAPTSGYAPTSPQDSPGPASRGEVGEASAQDSVAPLPRDESPQTYAPIHAKAHRQTVKLAPTLAKRPSTLDQTYNESSPDNSSDESNPGDSSNESSDSSCSTTDSEESSIPATRTATRRWRMRTRPHKRPRLFQVPTEPASSPHSQPLPAADHATQALHAFLMRKREGSEDVLTIKLPLVTVLDFLALPRAQSINSAVQAAPSFDRDLESERETQASSRYSQEEDDLLVRLKERSSPAMSWAQITSRFARRFPGRSKGSLQVHYSTCLKDRD